MTRTARWSCPWRTLESGATPRAIKPLAPVGPRAAKRAADSFTLSPKMAGPRRSAQRMMRPEAIEVWSKESAACAAATRKKNSASGVTKLTAGRSIVLAGYNSGFEPLSGISPAQSEARDGRAVANGSGTRRVFDSRGCSRIVMPGRAAVPRADVVHPAW